MKTRDDFIQSVWEKSEKALIEERRKKVQRRRRAGGLVAACLILVAGTTYALNPAFLAPGSTDEAIYESDNAEGEAVSSPTSSYGAPAGSDSAEVSYDGAFVGSTKLSGEELYDAMRKETDAAEKSMDSKPGDLMAYYCLPVGVVIETPEGAALYAGEEKEVMKYMKWFYSLPEDQIMTAEEYESLKEIPTGYYKFTMDQSIGADTESVDIVFWITGDVTLP
ncbi:MAG: hypothetical protein II354_02900 [Firmicutes bacterium]|nr:hypothetical protein [Bacillota bacterium]